MQNRNKAGLNIVKWDLRVQPLRPLPPPPGAPAGATGGGGGGGFGGGGNDGPFVLPGTYRATLNVDGKEAQSVSVTVKGDPEIEITEADRKVWFATARNLHDLQQQATDGAATVQAVSAHLATLQRQSRGMTLQPSLKQSVDTLSKEL